MSNSPKPTRINLQGEPLTPETAAEVERILREHGTPIETDADAREFWRDLALARAKWFKDRGLDPFS